MDWRMLIPRLRCGRSFLLTISICVTTLPFLTGCAGQDKIPSSKQKTTQAGAIISPTLPSKDSVSPVKNGLYVTIEPVKKAFSLSEPIVMKVTYHNTSKTAFRLPNQIILQPPHEIKFMRPDLFWQLILHEEATGKSYSSIEQWQGPDEWLTVRASAPIRPGESLEETVQLDRDYFHGDFPFNAAYAGPGIGASGVGYIPTGAYMVVVNIRFPVKPTPDSNPVPLWQGDSIETDPVEITIAPE
jgi:hypothetical protein